MPRNTHFGRLIAGAMIATVIFASNSVHAAPPDAPPDYETLTTGLGLGILFEPQLGQGPSTQLNTPYTAHYGDVIETAGFTAVRLRISMDQFTASDGAPPNYTLSSQFMNDLQFAVTNLLSRRTNTMYVFISPNGLEDNTTASELQMSNYWAQIATKFSNTTHRLIFNLMNEPNISTTEFTNMSVLASMYRATTTAVRASNPTRYLVYYHTRDEYVSGSQVLPNTPFSLIGPGETDFNHMPIPTNAGPYRIYDVHFLGDESPDGENKRAAFMRQAWEFRQATKYPVWSGAWNYGAWNTSWSTSAVARVAQNMKDYNLPGTYLMFNSSQTSIYDPVGSDRNTNGISDEWTQPAYPPIIVARNPIIWNSRAPFWTNSFHPQCDTYVKGNLTNEVNGETATLLVKDLGGGFERTAYLKFNLARQQPGAIVSAMLKLKSRTLAPGDTIQVRLASDSTGTTNWERSMAFSNAPNIGSTVLDTNLVNATNTWYEFDVTAAITNNGIYTLALTTTGTGLTEFFSRDQGDPDWLTAPDLVVTTARDYSWTSTANGNWSDTTKWLPSAAPGTSGTRVFITNNIANNRTITINVTNATVGSMTLGDIANASSDFTIATNGTGPLTFDNGGSAATLTNLAADIQNTINGSVILADDLLIHCAAHLTVNGSISGAGRKVTKSGPGLLTLGGNNSYTGDTAINAGAVWVNGVNSGTLTVNSNASVGGIGTLGNTLVINPGAILSPGTNSIGTLSVTSAPTLTGVTYMELNRSSSPNSDKLSCSSGNLVFSGTLLLTNNGVAPVNGDSFDLFDAAGFTGSFVSITFPPGGTTHWNTNLLSVSGAIVFTNNNPVVTDIALNVVSGVASNIAIIGTATPPTDADAGDVLLVSSVSVPTHGVATTDGTNISYTANYGYAGPDSFTYTVSDNFGGSATGNLTVNATPPNGFNLLTVEVLGPNSIRMSYLGIPGTNYALDTRTNLVLGNWTAVITNVAGSNGHLFFTNTPSEPTSYYRTRSLP